METKILWTMPHLIIVFGIYCLRRVCSQRKFWYNCQGLVRGRRETLYGTGRFWFWKKIFFSISYLQHPFLSQPKEHGYCFWSMWYVVLGWEMQFSKVSQLWNLDILPIILIVFDDPAPEPNSWHSLSGSVRKKKGDCLGRMCFFVKFHDPDVNFFHGPEQHGIVGPAFWIWYWLQVMWVLEFKQCLHIAWCRNLFLDVCSVWLDCSILKRFQVVRKGRFRYWVYGHR